MGNARKPAALSRDSGLQGEDNELLFARRRAGAGRSGPGPKSNRPNGTGQPKQSGQPVKSGGSSRPKQAKQSTGPARTSKSVESDRPDGSGRPRRPNWPVQPGESVPA